LDPVESCGPQLVWAVDLIAALPDAVTSRYTGAVNIFISHAERDRHYATALGQALKDVGLRVWEPLDVQPGENWGLKSGAALAASDAVVVLLSPDSVATEWVRREIEFAISSPRFKGRLIPVLLRPTRDVPWILRELPQWLESDDPTRAAKEIVNVLNAGNTVAKVRVKSQIAEMARKTRLGKKDVKNFMTSPKAGLKSRITKPAKDALLGAKK